MYTPNDLCSSDSPIEALLAYHLAKHLADGVELRSQHVVETLAGRFIIDFIAITPTGRRVGFECDGEAYHDPRRDEWRDAMILGDDRADVMYRLRGKDLCYRMEELLYLISCLDPELFSERGRYNISRLAAEEAMAFYEPSHTSEFHHVSFTDEGGDKQNVALWRRARKVPAGFRQFWQAAYRYAVAVGGRPLDELMASYRDQEQTSC